MAGADLSDVDIVDRDRQIAAHVELVSPTDDNPVKPRDGGLPQISQPFVHLNEFPHPFPVVSRPLKKPLLLVQIGASAECPVAFSSQNKNGNGIVPAGIFECHSHLLQHRMVDGVQYLGPVDGYRRFVFGFFIPNC